MVILGVGRYWTSGNIVGGMYRVSGNIGGQGRVGPESVIILGVGRYRVSGNIGGGGGGGGGIGSVVILGFGG